MKTRYGHGLLFGIAVICVAAVFSVSLLGCPTETKEEEKKAVLSWPDGFTFKESGDSKIGTWKMGEGIDEKTLIFHNASSGNNASLDNGSTALYYITDIDGNKYTLKGAMSIQPFTFKAELSSDGNSITISESSSGYPANGTYTKVTD